MTRPGWHNPDAFAEAEAQREARELWAATRADDDNDGAREGDTLGPEYGEDWDE